jgi:GTP-binding protein
MKLIHCRLFTLLANVRSSIANLSMRVLARFLAAATDAAHFPAPTLPEIAFLGRSNVGKSSVINSLVGAKLARTSSTPGRTRSINFFEVRWPGKPQPELIFADLPGYGYAKISREISQEWPKFIEPYLNQRPSLALCVALVDANVPPQASDRQLLDFLNASGREFLLVATKSDRLSNNQLNNALRKFTQEYPAARPLPYSSKTGAGRDELWKRIRQAAQQVTPVEVPSNAPEIRKSSTN